MGKDDRPLLTWTEVNTGEHRVERAPKSELFQFRLGRTVVWNEQQWMLTAIDCNDHGLREALETR